MSNWIISNCTNNLVPACSLWILVLERLEQEDFELRLALTIQQDGETWFNINIDYK